MSDASEPELPAPVPEKRDAVTPDLPPAVSGAPDLPGAASDQPRTDDAAEGKKEGKEEDSDEGAAAGPGRTKAQEPPD